jgi:multidrug efflux pump subunit AcrA (membrane-fusion protein)
MCEQQNYTSGPSNVPANHGLLRRIWSAFDFLIIVNLARLRFIVIVAAIGAVILYWDALTAYYERWTRPLTGETAAAVSDNEYWCPMHPTVIREKPDKCPICAMPLSKRKKSETAGSTETLAHGAARVQLTPYKVVNAGIRTAEVGYQPLTKEITTVGFVEYDERKLSRITARTAGKSRIEKLFVNVTGQTVKKGEPLAELYSPELLSTVTNLLDARQSGNRDIERGSRDRLRLWGIDDAQIEQILKDGKPITHITIRSPLSGHVIKKYQVEGEYVEEGAKLFDVADLSTVWIEGQVYEDQIAFVHEGLPVTAVTKAFPDREFSGKVAFITPWLDTNTRTIRIRFDMQNPGNELRRGMYASVALQVPAIRLSPLPPDTGEEEKRMQEQGLVLAVPESAVIDTGSRKIVYRESELDEFEGVDVRLGPRCGAFYPVLSGLRAGDRIATSGSFLIDAETRLTAGASSTYFGSAVGPTALDHGHAALTARPSMTRDDADKVQAALVKIDTVDRKLAETQIYCPVLTDNRLGVMGKPVKVLVQGQPVLLCCKACVNKALADTSRTLAKVGEFKTHAKVGAVDQAQAADESGGSNASKIRAALAKLSAADRRLAEAQGFCPESNSPLGSMGVPLKISLNGQPVFICCRSCEDEAREHADKTLAKIAEFKEKVKSAHEHK